MTDTDKKLYELLGDKTLSFGCVIRSNFSLSYRRILKAEVHEHVTDFSYVSLDCSATGSGIAFRNDEYEIIGHEPTIADFHRWMKSSLGGFVHEVTHEGKNDYLTPRNGREIRYDSSKSLLLQSEETKSLIISLIESYGKN